MDCAITRASASLGPPAANGTMRLMLRVGKFCADALTAAKASSATARRADFFIGYSFGPVCQPNHTQTCKRHVNRTIRFASLVQARQACTARVRLCQTANEWSILDDDKN